MSFFDKLRRPFVFAIVAAVVAQLHLSAPTKAEEVVKLAVGEWKPFISETLPEYGPVLEVVSRAFEIEGIKAEYTFLPWKRAMGMTRNGKFDGTPGWVFSDERAVDFRYSDSLLTQRDQIFFHRDNPIEFESAEDFSGMRTRILIGSYIGDEFAQLADRGQLTIKESRSYVDMFKKLLRNKIDFLYLSEPVGAHVLNRELTKVQREQIVVKESFRKPHEYHLLVSKQNENGLRVLRAFNSGLTKLKASGDYDRIIGKAHN